MERIKVIILSNQQHVIEVGISKVELFFYQIQVSLQLILILAFLLLLSLNLPYFISANFLKLKDLHNKNCLILVKYEILWNFVALQVFGDLGQHFLNPINSLFYVDIMIWLVALDYQCFVNIIE